jgi:hypothetical protein
MILRVRWLLLRPVSAGVALILVALAAFGGAAAAAANPVIPSASGVFTGCLAGDGTVKLIDPTIATCPKATKVVTWNQVGQRGLQGPSGPAGATGAQGAAGPQGPGAMTYLHAIDGQEISVPLDGYRVIFSCSGGGPGIGIANDRGLGSTVWAIYETKIATANGGEAITYLSNAEVHPNSASGSGTGPLDWGTTTVTAWTEPSVGPVRVFTLAEYGGSNSCDHVVFGYTP